VHGKTEAAPAILSGERLSYRITDAERRREGQLAAAAREPGDLPLDGHARMRWLGMPAGRNTPITSFGSFGLR
jgi:hypothetical protein